MIGKILKALEPVIEAELDRAQWENGETFESRHEGYAVLLEEYEECVEDIDDMKFLIDEMWVRIKGDLMIPMMHIDAIRSMAARTAAEAVQIAAMADKFALLIDEEEKDGEESACD